MSGTGMRLRVVTIWRANAKLRHGKMNEHDVVRVKETVVVTPITDESPVEIQAGWEGVIVECADTHAPMVEFMKYREEPIIAHIEASNLEAIRPSKRSTSNLR
jgi:hypothetical protein